MRKNNISFEVVRNETISNVTVFQKSFNSVKLLKFAEIH